MTFMTGRYARMAYQEDPPQVRTKMMLVYKIKNDIPNKTDLFKTQSSRLNQSGSFLRVRFIACLLLQ